MARIAAAGILVAAASILVAFASLGACSPAADGRDAAPPPAAPDSDPALTCVAGETYCADEETVLYCSASATLATAPCRGPDGCTVNGEGVVCDDSLAVPGDPCAVPGHAACSRDKILALACNASHHYETLQRCDGPGACTAAGGVARCDDSIAHAGDRCAREGEVSCSADRAQALECKEGAFVVASPCEGPAHCRVEGGAVFCDQRVAGRQDACARESQLACSSSGTTLLRCTSGQFSAYNSCDGPGGCSIAGAGAGDGGAEAGAGGAVVCDDSIAVAEEPCAREGEPACSVDGKSYLTCTGHRFARAGDCAHGGCRYDPGSDSVRCDQKTVSAWPTGAAERFAGRWALHWRGGRCTSHLSIDVAADGSRTMKLIDCYTHKPVELVQRTAQKAGDLEFMEKKSGFLYRVMLVGSELREDVDYRPDYVFTRE